MIQFIPLLVVVLLAATLIIINERYRIFTADRFPTMLHRVAAYVWMFSLFVLVGILISTASSEPLKASDIAGMSFWSLFGLHIVLVVFLFGWWALTSTPPIRSYLNLRSLNLHSFFSGIIVGLTAWGGTIGFVLLIALALKAANLLPPDVQPSPIISWMANLQLWQKGVIVFTAMTVEEAFFRGWLQKRIGLLASTVLFALAHAGYGQPFLLIGVTVVSLVIGYTFYRTRNLIPCVIAHGVFDGIQLFVVVPLALRLAGH